MLDVRTMMFVQVVSDDVLQVFANMLMNMRREHDIVGRYGGEEFCLLPPDTTLQGA